MTLHGASPEKLVFSLFGAYAIKFLIASQIFYFFSSIISFHIDFDSILEVPSSSGHSLSRFTSHDIFHTLSLSFLAKDEEITGRAGPDMPDDGLRQVRVWVKLPLFIWCRYFIYYLMCHDSHIAAKRNFSAVSRSMTYIIFAKSQKFRSHSYLLSSSRRDISRLSDIYMLHALRRMRNEWKIVILMHATRWRATVLFLRASSFSPLRTYHWHGARRNSFHATSMIGLVT